MCKTHYTHVYTMDTVHVALPTIILTFHQQRDTDHQLCHLRVLPACQLVSYPDTPFGIAYVVQEPTAGTILSVQPNNLEQACVRLFKSKHSYSYHTHAVYQFLSILIINLETFLCLFECLKYSIHW